MEIAISKGSEHTAGIMTGSQKDATCGIAFSDDMASSGCGKNAILSDQELFHPVSCTDLCYQLYHLGIVVSTISTDDEEASLNTFGYGEEDASDERFAVVGLLEDFDLFSKSRAIEMSVRWSKTVQLTVVDSQWYAVEKSYVPGFWSVKGFKETVLTLMMSAKVSNG